MNLLRAVTLTAWGIGLAVLLVARRYSLFIRAELWPLLAGTLVMFLLFLLAMFVLRGSAKRKAIRPAALLQSGMLLLPLLYMFTTMSGSAAASGLNQFAFQKRSLGANAGFDSASALTDNTIKSASDSSPVQSLGYIAKHYRRMDGRHIITEGRVFHDEDAPKDQTTIYRFVVVCCAADAMPVQVLIKSPDAGRCKQDSWIRVEGTLHRTVDGPVIDATRIKEIPPPAQPYLSPYHW